MLTNHYIRIIRAAYLVSKCISIHRVPHTLPSQLCLVLSTPSVLNPSCGSPLLELSLGLPVLLLDGGRVDPRRVPEETTSLGGGARGRLLLVLVVRGGRSLLVEGKSREE